MGSAVRVEGEVVLREGGQMEIRAGSVGLLSPLTTANYLDSSDGIEIGTGNTGQIFGAMSRSRPHLGLLRSERGLFWRHRLPELAAMLRLRAACKSNMRSALQTRGYLEV